MSMFSVSEGAAIHFPLPVFLEDAAGAGVAGVTPAIVTVNWWSDVTAVAAITPVAGVHDSWSSGGWAAKPSAMDGNYVLWLPEACFTTGKRYVVVEIQATGCVPRRYTLDVGPFNVTLATDVNGVIDANVVSLSGDQTSVLRMLAGTKAMFSGVLTTGGANNIAATGLPAGLTASSLVGRKLAMISGNALLQAQTITAYNATTDVITLANDLTIAAAIGDEYVIY